MHSRNTCTTRSRTSAATAPRRRAAASAARAGACRWLPLGSGLCPLFLFLVTVAPVGLLHPVFAAVAVTLSVLLLLLLLLLAVIIIALLHLRCAEGHTDSTRATQIPRAVQWQCLQST